MTWAKNYGDRIGGTGSVDGKRAPRIEKRCKCGALIPKRKTWCGPCYDVRLHENIAKNRKAKTCP